jgi:hypothetical protein
MIVMEEVCQTSLIKWNNPVTTFIFGNGVSNVDLDVKKALPNDGYVILDNECSVTNFYLADQNNVYANSEDIENLTNR